MFLFFNATYAWRHMVSKSSLNLISRINVPERRFRKYPEQQYRMKGEKKNNKQDSQGPCVSLLVVILVFYFKHQ